MKYLLCALLLTFALFEVIHATDFDINNGEVRMNGKKVNFDDLEVVEDTPDHITYKVEDGNTHATIIRYKNGNGITIQSSSNTMTPQQHEEFKKNMDKLQEEMSHLGEKIKHEVDSESDFLMEDISFKDSAPPFPLYPSNI